MRIARVLLPFATAVASSLALVACEPPLDVNSVDQASDSSAIINGSTCDETQFTTAVAVLVDATITIQGFGTQPIHSVVCTGTLIAPDVVLTAAHCLDPAVLGGGFGTVTDQKYFVATEPDLSGLFAQSPPPFPDDAIEVTDFIKNPEFDINQLNSVNGPGAFHDVGLLFLSRKMDGVQPEVVIGADEVAQLKQGAPVDIAGWGSSVEGGGNPLQPPAPGTVGIKICGASTINELGDAEMQIGGDDTTTRKCHGDSGGPTYINVETSHAIKRRVIGITSHAYDQTDCAKGGVDTRVDAQFDFINTEMTKRCTEPTKTRVACDVPGIIPASFYDPPVVVTPPDNKPGAKTVPESCLGDCSQGSSTTSLMGALALGLLALRRRRR